MAITKCEKGHFYDNAKYDSCPYCVTLEHERNRYEDQMRENSVIIPARRPMDDDVTVAMPKKESGDDQVTVSLIQPQEAVHGVSGDDQKTIGIFGSRSGQEYVTGWLVCVKGNEKGRDYRLHNGNNWIGRSYQMDICIVDDPKISRENHATIVFEPRSSKFFLTAGKGTITTCNGEMVTKAVELKSRDCLGLGESEFVFIPFCKEGQTWEKED